MINFILICFGKCVMTISRVFNLGNGSTWPGHIALSVNPSFVKDILRNSGTKIILIAGTNGKTTTGKLLQTILEKNGKKVFQNESGANLLNGIASSLITHANFWGSITSSFAIFEVDENALPHVLQQITPDYIVLLNLFRDQLDRYGEVNTIAHKWEKAISGLSSKTTLILNADDPQIAHLGLSLYSSREEQRDKSRKSLLDSSPQDRTIVYFGVNDKDLSIKNPQHAADSLYCLQCGAKLTYSSVYFSHIGIWHCPKCKEKRPEISIQHTIYPLPGVYNRYNTLAAVLTAQLIGIDQKAIKVALEQFSPAFGRQEEISFENKTVKVFLSKNPTSFNESLRTIKDLNGNHILFVLNDRIPDGRDISWIWDVDFEEFLHRGMKITISGDRCHELALRIKYVDPLILNTKDAIQKDVKTAIITALEKTLDNDVLYILPTYSAMLEVRQMLTGRKIL